MKSMMLNLCRFALFLAFIALAGNPGLARATEKVGEVQVLGTQRIDPATVLSYMDLQVGDDLTQEGIDASLKSLFRTGLFADVVIQQDGSALIVKVSENPIINDIAFEGNDKVDDKDLLAEIQLRPRQVFTRTKVQSDIARLYQIYRRQGRFSASIEPKIIKLDQNRVNLVFEIDEGPVTKVQTVRFIGNRRFNDDQLREVMSTKETRWYRFISANDRYDPDRMEYDKELLRRYYLAQGYADYQLISAVAELDRDRQNFFMTFTLEEGERYKFGAVKIDSKLRNFDVSQLNESIAYAEGDWYNADLVQKTIDNITNKLGDLQYAFVSVKPDVSRDREKRTIDLTFIINETPRVFVERININGNVRTMDEVVRRELSVAEGDPFSREKLARSETKVKDLDYFETVKVETKRGSAPDKSVVDINVEEKSTGELSIGAGFSTSDGPLADLRIRERNLLGRGQDLLFATTIAGERTEFDVSFTEPYFLDRKLAAGVDLFHITRDLQDESSFDQRRTGGGLRLGYPLSEHWDQTLRYRIEQNDIRNVDEDASRYIQDQEGERLTSAVSQRIAYDNRDSKLFPTDGWYVWFETELAGLGGDAKYVSGKAGASYFYPVTEKVVLNVLGEGGVIEGIQNEDVNINERFFLGGQSLRGFERAGVGPRDVATDDALGGNRFYRGSVELSFPIGLPEELGITGHSFADAGSLFNVDDTASIDLRDESSLRSSVGVGLSWKSPLGPIRVDAAKPITKEDYDSEELFRFNFGTRF